MLSWLRDVTISKCLISQWLILVMTTMSAVDMTGSCCRKPPYFFLIFFLFPEQSFQNWEWLFIIATISIGTLIFCQFWNKYIYDEKNMLWRSLKLLNPPSQSIERWPVKVNKFSLDWKNSEGCVWVALKVPTGKMKRY